MIPKQFHRKCDCVPLAQALMPLPCRSPPSHSYLFRNHSNVCLHLSLCIQVLALVDVQKHPTMHKQQTPYRYLPWNKSVICDCVPGLHTHAAAPAINGGTWNQDRLLFLHVRTSKSSQQEIAELSNGIGGSSCRERIRCLLCSISYLIYFLCSSVVEAIQYTSSTKTSCNTTEQWWVCCFELKLLWSIRTWWPEFRFVSKVTRKLWTDFHEILGKCW